MRGIIPGDVAIAIFNFVMFSMWIMLTFTGRITYQLAIFPAVATAVGLAIASYTTWVGIRAYRKWRDKDVEKKH